MNYDGALTKEQVALILQAQLERGDARRDAQARYHDALMDIQEAYLKRLTRAGIEPDSVIETPDNV